MKKKLEKNHDMIILEYIYIYIEFFFRLIKIILLENNENNETQYFFCIISLTTKQRTFSLTKDLKRK